MTLSLAPTQTQNPWRIYRGWFWAATVYNILWGTVVGLKPTLMLGWMGMNAAQQAAAGPLPAILAACIGMFVGVYALGYACVALNPPRFWPFAQLGLCGTIFGSCAGHDTVSRATLNNPAQAFSKENTFMNNENWLRNILVGGALTGLLALVLIRLGWE